MGKAPRAQRTLGFLTSLLALRKMRFVKTARLQSGHKTRKFRSWALAPARLRWKEVGQSDDSLWYPFWNLFHPNSVTSDVRSQGGPIYCSGCGQPLATGQPVCTHCGRPASAAVPPVPGFAFEVENYAGKIRALSVVWAIYAAFALLTGIAGLTFAHAFMTNHFGPFGQGPFGGGQWGNSPFPEEWFGHALFGFIWMALLVRTALAIFVA